LFICFPRLILDKTKVSIKSFVQQFKVEHVVYASGFNPKHDKNDDLWDRTHAISGDDFAENIPLDISQLNRLRDGGNLTIKLTPTTLQVEA